MLITMCCLNPRGFKVLLFFLMSSHFLKVSLWEFPRHGVKMGSSWLRWVPKVSLVRGYTKCMLEIVWVLCTCTVIPCEDRHVTMHYQALCPVLSPCYLSARARNCCTPSYSHLVSFSFALLLQMQSFGIPHRYAGWGTFSKYVPLGRSLRCVLGTLNDVRCANENSRSPIWVGLSRESQLQGYLSSLHS